MCQETQFTENLGFKQGQVVLLSSTFLCEVSLAKHVSERNFVLSVVSAVS